MTRCLIVDDEPVAQRIIASYLADIPGMQLAASCSNAIEAMSVLERETIDLIFLDIEMPRIKGLDFLKSLHRPPAVIIVTAYRDFALDGFDLGVVDYLLKPISFERFFQAINKYRKELNRVTIPGQPFIFLKSDRKTYKIDTTRILYIEGMSNYVKVVLNDRKLVVYDSLNAIAEKLPATFIRIHKSYIINTGLIDAYSNEYVEIGGTQVPLGGSYRKDTLAKLNSLEK